MEYDLLYLGGTDMIYTLQTDVALVTVCDENFLNILRTALHHEQVGIQLPGNQWKKILEISPH